MEIKILDSFPEEINIIDNVTNKRLNISRNKLKRIKNNKNGIIKI